MPQRVFDRIKETTTTTGTGDLTLAGAASGFKTFASRFTTGGSMQAAWPIAYAIVGGTEWETGLGYLSGASTLVRSIVGESSNADALVNFSAGTKEVFCTIRAARMEDIFTKGQSYALQVGLNLP